MEKMVRIFLVVSVVLLMAGPALASNGGYIPPSSDTKPIVGNWMRTFRVNNGNGDTFWQMEVRTFTVNGGYRAYFYVEGATRPFQERMGSYLIEKPLLVLRDTGKDGVVVHEEIWKDCVFAADTMTCKVGDENISYSRWLQRPDRLREPYGKNSYNR